MQNASKKLSWREKENICKAWSESGLSKSKFCINNQLALSTLIGWCSRIWPINKAKTESNLCEIKVRGRSSSREEKISSSLRLELFFAEGIRAKIEGSLVDIKSVIKELSDAAKASR